MFRNVIKYDDNWNLIVWLIEKIGGLLARILAEQRLFIEGVNWKIRQWDDAFFFHSRCP